MGLLARCDRLGIPRRVVGLVLGLQLAGAVVELLGLMILLPVFQFVQTKGDVAALVAEYRHWRVLAGVYDRVGLPTGLASLLGTSFALLLLRQAFVIARLRYVAAVKETAVMRVRVDLFQDYLHADLQHQEAQSAGAVVSDMTIDLRRAIEYLFGRIAVVGLALLAAIYVAGLLLISAPLTGIAVVIFGAAFLALRTQLGRSERAGAAFTTANQQMSAFLVERLKQARLIRLAGTERAEIDEMNALVRRQRDTMVRIVNLLSNAEIIVEPIVVGAAFVFLYVSVTLFNTPLEAIGLFLVMVMRLLPVVKEGARMNQSARAMKPSCDAVIRRNKAGKAAREPASGERAFDRVSNAVRIDRVAFSYRSAGSPSAALHDVSLTIPAGRITALVGPSGAGKSTLVDLLPKLRTPDSGTVSIDGVLLDRFELASLRRGIAYVPQVPQIFDVTVTEHIRYGKADASQEEVVAAAKLAGADRFIRTLPQGYEARCGHAGGWLSGGQRQRLDLARALVRRAPILLLDEPTSSLDAESEHLLRETLRTLRSQGDTTIVVIAHRLSTVALADQIVVLEGGRVAALGTHAELVRAPGWYAEAFAKQAIVDTPPIRAFG